MACQHTVAVRGGSARERERESDALSSPPNKLAGESPRPAGLPSTGCGLLSLRTVYSSTGAIGSWSSGASGALTRTRRSVHRRPICERSRLEVSFALAASMTRRAMSGRTRCTCFVSWKSVGISSGSTGDEPPALRYRLGCAGSAGAVERLTERTRVCAQHKEEHHQLLCDAARCKRGRGSTHQVAAAEEGPVRLHERALEPRREPVLPHDELRTPLVLALALVERDGDLVHLLHRLGDLGVRVEQGGERRRVGRDRRRRRARQERLEEEPVPRDALDREEEVRLERDLRVRRVGSGALQDRVSSQLGAQGEEPGKGDAP